MTQWVSKMMNNQKSPNAYLWSYVPVDRTDTLPEAFWKLSRLGPSKTLRILVQISATLGLSRFRCELLRFSSSDNDSPRDALGRISKLALTTLVVVRSCRLPQAFTEAS